MEAMKEFRFFLLLSGWFWFNNKDNGEVKGGEVRASRSRGHTYTAGRGTWD